MYIGILAGLITGALWGFTFVAPRAVFPFTELDIAIGRYFIFGIASVLLFLHPKFRPGQIPWRLAIQAMLLGGVGYVSYFVAASYAVRFSGTAVPPLVIGLMPVILAVVSNFREKTVTMAELSLPLIMIFLGVMAVNLSTYLEAETAASQQDALIGILLAFIALAIWVGYAMINARALKSKAAPDMLPWTCLQGVGAAIGTVPLMGIAYATGETGFGTVPIISVSGANFLFWALLMGVVGSWVATWCWSIASKRLPLALTAQLIVAETVFGLIYGYIYEQRMPTAWESIGGSLQIAGVMFAIAVFSGWRISWQMFGRPVPVKLVAK